MTEHPNYKYRPRRRKHTKPRAGPQNGNNSTANATTSTNNTGNNNSSSSNANSNGTPSSTPSTHNQSSSEVQYERMSPYNYNGIYYNDGSTLTSPGHSSPSPSPPNSHGKKHAFKMEDVPTPEMSPMNENVHSSKIDYEQALPATTTSNFNNNKNHHRYTYDTTNNYEISTAGQKGATYHYVTNSDRMYESQQHQMTSNLVGDKKSAYNMPMTSAATTATTIAAMGNGMYVMCSNRGVLDQGHVVTGTYFPPLPTSQDHQNLGTNSILTSSSHHHHHHYMNTTQTTSSLAGNQIMSGGNSTTSNNSNDVKFKSNDSNNNKHGSENNNNNNNKTNKLSEINNGKIESKNGGGFKSTAGKNGSTGSLKSDDIDDKLIKNDTNNNNHPDNKNGSNNNRLILSSPSASALSPYHHQSYLSQYKNHMNYGDHTTTAVIAQSQMQDDGNFTAAATGAEYDPYHHHHHQNNPIYYHPTSHFTHSHPSLNTLPPTSVASPTTFYVTNPDYYHQSYSMAAPNIQATTNVPTSGVQPMVAKIDAVIGATTLHHHPSQNIIHSEPYVVGVAEPLKEDEFSNILAGVRKTCYSN
jgi:transcription factor SOX7/8/10/18 (SOX group E/F)